MILKLKVWLLKKLLKDVAGYGIEGDTKLAHINDFEDKLLKSVGGEGSINLKTGLVQMKGGGGSQTQTTNQNIDPAILPYITYGLGEAQNLYKADSPEYYPDATYVPASESTQDALRMASNRAVIGNPLVPAAQAQQLSTISGDRLSAGNPYFSAMMASAATPAVNEFNKAIRDIGSRTAASGRYGSGAMGEMESQASENLANSLTNRAAELAYSNFGAERARQDAAIAQAPQMAAADYSDIQQLMNVGQQQEDYSRQALQSDIGRFEFEQNKPYTKLQSYLSAAYGAPAPINSTTQSSGGGGK
jgi:hypothetical protein